MALIETEETTERQGMTLKQFENYVSQEISQGQTFLESDIQERRERNLQYYQGIMKDLTVPEGRSRTTDRAVSENINLILPSLLRVFTSGPFIGEFKSRDGQNEHLLQEITEAVDYAIKRDNDGDLMLYDWAFDAMVQVVGVVKGYWKEKYEYETQQLEGMNELQFRLVARQVETDPSLTLTGIQEVQVEVEGPEGEIAFAPQYSVEITRTVNASYCATDIIPPEEFVVSADARSLKQSRLKSHRTVRTVGSLIEEGYDYDTVMRLPTYTQTELDSIRRRRSTVGTQNNAGDPMMREVSIHQGIVEADYDGTGIKDWYFVAGGDETVTTMLEVEEYDYQIIFADFCPEPMPHSFIGRCPADDLVELQRVNTALIRQLLDNLYLSNSPQREVVTENIEDIDQLMNMAPGALVGVTELGSVNPLVVPFTAEASFGALGYFNTKAEDRTGVSKNSMGLNPDALQNQSATAAAIAKTASHGKIEMYARIWAQGGMKALLLGIFNILKRYQAFPRTIRVGNESRVVDPREWRNVEIDDVVINTGLGTGTNERDMAMLSMIGAQQEKVLTTMGPNNPLVTMGQWLNTQRKIIEASGMTDASQFWKDLPLDYVPPPQPPQPDPAQVALQVKQQEAQIDAAVETQKNTEKAQLQVQEANLDLEADLAKIAAQAQEDRETAILNHRLKQEELRQEAALKGFEMSLNEPGATANIPEAEV